MTAPILPLWLICALAAAVLAATMLQYRSIARRLGRKKALPISLLRLGALWLAVVFAINPSLVQEREQKIFPTIALLVDTSLTMGLAWPFRARPAGSTRRGTLYPRDGRACSPPSRGPTTCASMPTTGA